MMSRFIAVPLIIAFLAGVCLAGDLNVGNFTAGDLSGWTPKVFKGLTLYTLAREGDRTVLKAYGRNSASGLFKKVKVNPFEYPVLRWSWKIDHTLKREDATRKNGDDFAARVYVVFPGMFFWTTRTIVYVWSGKLPKGSALKNPYTSNAIVIAAESGDGLAGKWINEERNYYRDYRRLFGEEPSGLGAVAVMTDTDDTRDEATAWYGDIFLAREQAQKKH
jgi:hypothetical protein